VNELRPCEFDARANGTVHFAPALADRALVIVTSQTAGVTARMNDHAAGEMADPLSGLQSARDPQPDELRAELARLQRELVAVRSALEASHDNLTKKILELDAIAVREAAALAAAEDAERQLERARATIASMERSVFWRVRKLLRRP